MYNRKITMRAMGKDYLKTNPPVKECIKTFLIKGSDFAYGFAFPEEYSNLPEYMIQNEEAIKNAIEEVIKSMNLKFDKIIMLFEIYEVYEGYNNLGSFLDKLLKIDTPNQKRIRWYKFLYEEFTSDFRTELNYDFEELVNLIEM